MAQTVAHIPNGVVQNVNRAKTFRQPPQRTRSFRGTGSCYPESWKNTAWLALVDKTKKVPLDMAVEEFHKVLTASKKSEREEGIIDLVTSFNVEERQEIERLYGIKYNKELSQVLEKTFSGKFEDVLLALMTSPARYDAKQLRDAMKALGTDEDTILEIVLTRDPRQIEEIKEVYRQEYKKELYDEIKSELSGAHWRLVKPIIANETPSSDHVSLAKIIKDTNDLVEAGENRFGTDESVFERVLSDFNRRRLYLLLFRYRQTTGGRLRDTIVSEMSGDDLKFYTAIVDAIEDVPGYFAERLHDSMEGLGTDDHILIRVMVSRFQVDLCDIIRRYAVKFRPATLMSDIKGDTSGPYEKLLLKMADVALKSEADE